MTETVYFFDSYAVIEMLKGSPAYGAYTKTTVMFTQLNLFEVYYYLLRTLGEKEAETFMKEYADCCIEIDNEGIADAAKLKYAHKKRKLSMTDCVGYVLAKKWNVLFLTGDKEFKEIEGVEYVK